MSGGLERDFIQAQNAVIKLVAQVDAWKTVARQAGVCMSCAVGNREPCLDCMNTGWESGIDPAQARKDALEEAANVAEWAHMVDPDGGCPTDEEKVVADTAARRIRALINNRRPS